MKKCELTILPQSKLMWTFAAKISSNTLAADTSGPSHFWITPPPGDRWTTPDAAIYAARSILARIMPKCEVTVKTESEPVTIKYGIFHN
jgi:hypothetical protein